MRKFLPYIFIILVLFGLFSPIFPLQPLAVTHAADSTPSPTQPGTFQSEVNKWECGIFGDEKSGGGGSITGCVVQIVNIMYYIVPAFLLAVVAHVFNIVLYASMDSSLINSPFVAQAWTIVRDLSNVFFILILLYIAIKIILDLDAAGAKKMIAKVIIVAMLINFSLFMTGVVIDASNILALIFYNKMDTVTNAGGQPRPYNPIRNEKDMSGALVENFDPTNAVSGDFLNKLREAYINSTHVTTSDPLPAGMIIGFLLFAGSMMYYVAVVLAIAGVAFIVRIIELWILSIFSPFAMITSTVPKFANIEYLGWDKWFSRLIKTSFMAPIFMFFLYFIFLLLNAGSGGGVFAGFIPDNSASTDIWVIVMSMLLKIALPLLFICIMLYKALKFAVMSSGKVGEMAEKGLKAAAGLAVTATVGAVTGGAGLAAGLATRGAAAGAATAGRSTLGRIGSAMANSQGLKEMESAPFVGGIGRVLRKTGATLGSASYDVRGIKGADKLAAKAGLYGVGKAQEGGFEGGKQREIEKRQKRAKELQVGENEPLKQKLNETEMQLQGVLSKNAQIIETLDKSIEKARTEVSDTEKAFNAAKGTKEEEAAKDAWVKANNELRMAKENKKDFRSGNDYMVTDAHGTTSMEKGTGVNINNLEGQKRQQEQAIKTENARRNQNYAQAQRNPITQKINLILSGGVYTKEAAAEAAHKIVMETKLDSGTKT